MTFLTEETADGTSKNDGADDSNILKAKIWKLALKRRPNLRVRRGIFWKLAPNPYSSPCPICPVVFWGDRFTVYCITKCHGILRRHVTSRYRSNVSESSVSRQDVKPDSNRIQLHTEQERDGAADVPAGLADTEWASYRSSMAGRTGDSGSSTERPL